MGEELTLGSPSAKKLQFQPFSALHRETINLYRETIE